MVKSILVSDEEYELLNQARDAIVHHGVKSLGSDLAEEIKKNNLKIERFSRGTVIALGSLLIVRTIRKEQEGIQK